MIISVKSNDFKLLLPIPLSLLIIIIKFIPENRFGDYKKNLIIKLLKILKKNSKYYKGLKILEVISQTGDYIVVRM